MLKLYGIPQARAFRPLRLLHELDLPYGHARQDYRSDALAEPDYLAINPNGDLLTLVDNELALWESMAIDLSLAHTQAQAV